MLDIIVAGISVSKGPLDWASIHRHMNGDENFLGEFAKWGVGLNRLVPPPTFFCDHFEEDPINPGQTSAGGAEFYFCGISFSRRVKSKRTNWRMVRLNIFLVHHKARMI